MRKLDDKLSISGQLNPEDMQALAGMGYRAVICNRPDGESFNQPSHDVMESAARAAGLKFHYIPVTQMTLNPDTAMQFRRAMDEAGGLVHAYCASGNRSGMLWQMANAISGRSAA